MKTRFLAAAALAASVVAAAPASAATFISFNGTTGVFGNTAISAVDGMFADVFTFQTPSAFGDLAATISSIALDAATNVDFTRVRLNGVDFDRVSTGAVEFRSVTGVDVRPGALQRLVVNGTSGTAGSYSGTLAFRGVGAVPEPATWAMMIMGFGLVGYAMRRRSATFGAASA